MTRNYLGIVILTPKFINFYNKLWRTMAAFMFSKTYFGNLLKGDALGNSKHERALQAHKSFRWRAEQKRASGASIKGHSVPSRQQRQAWADGVGRRLVTLSWRPQPGHKHPDPYQHCHQNGQGSDWHWLVGMHSMVSPIGIYYAPAHVSISLFFQIKLSHMEIEIKM